MTRLTRSGPREAVAWLRVDLGQWHRREQLWIRPPTADFDCRCGHSASASGDQVRHFVAHHTDTHKQTCPLRED